MANNREQPKPTLSQHDVKHLLRKSGYYRELVTFRLACWLTNAPNFPYRLDVVLETLIGALQEAVNKWTPKATNDDPFPADKICRRISRLEQLRAVLGSLIPVIQTDGRIENIYDLEDHALYVCLARTPKNELDDYPLLRAHLFFAACMTELRHRSLRAYEHQDEGNRERLFKEQYRSSLAIGQLARSVPWQSAMLAALKSSLPPIQFALRTLPESESAADRVTEVCKIRIGLIRSYIKQAHGIRERVERKVSAHKKHSVPSVILPRDPDDDFMRYGNLDIGSYGGYGGGGGSRQKGEETPEDSLPPLVLTIGAEEPTETVEEALANDHCPDEFEETVVVSWSVDGDTFKNSPGSYEGFSAAQLNHLIKSTKVFPFACDHLHPEELIVIEVDVRTEIEEGLRSAISADDLVALEPKIIALVMLWTSRSLESVLDLVEIGDEDSYPGAEIACVRSCGHRFRVAVPFPDYATEQDRVYGQEKELTPFFLMPDSAELGKLLAAFSAKQVALGVRAARRAQLFTRAHDDYKIELKSLFGKPEYQARRCERLTLTKLASALYVRTFNATGKDITATTIICGKPSHLSRVPMFYCCRSHEKIEQIYDKVVSEFRREIRDAAGFLNKAVIE